MISFSWIQCKKELPIFVYLSVIQIWLNFNFPAFNRLGSPVVQVLLSIVSVGVYLHVILFTERYVKYIDMSFLDDFPDPALVKNIFKAGMLFVLHVSYLYLWLINFYGVASIWYLILYVHWAITFLLLYNAISSKRSLESER